MPRLEPVADLGRLCVRPLLRSGVAAGRELLGRLAGARDQLERAVALELERAAVDEMALDVLRGLREEPRLAERRRGEDVRRAGGRCGREVAIVVVDLGLARQVETAVERAVDGLELLLLVDPRRAVVVAEGDAGREERAEARRPRDDADRRRPRGGGVEVRDGCPLRDDRGDRGLVGGELRGRGAPRARTLPRPAASKSPRPAAPA